MGLRGSWHSVSSEFNARVKKRFPVGSSEADMAEELRREGFLRNDWSYVNAPAAEAEAMRREDGFPCNQAAYVYWRADISGKLTGIRALYREEGCL
jgi:hypothetical protein